MKKTLLFAGAALLALAACNKTQTVVDVQPQEVSLVAGISSPTKADPELTDTNLPSSYTMEVSATSRDANGTIETAKYMTGTVFSYNASHKWTASPKVYWPLGGSTLDFLAIAFPTA